MRELLFSVVQIQKNDVSDSGVLSGLTQEKQLERWKLYKYFIFFLSSSYSNFNALEFMLLFLMKVMGVSFPERSVSLLS